FASEDHVVAGVAVDRIVAAAAVLRVGAAAALDGVVAAAAVDHVVGVGTDDQIVGVGADDVLDVGHDVVALAGRAVIGHAVDGDLQVGLVGDVGGIQI